MTVIDAATIRYTVAPIIPLPTQYGLFSVLDFSTPTNTGELVGGVTWAAHYCGDLLVTEDRDSCLSDDPIVALDPFRHCEFPTAEPFTIVAFEESSAGHRRDVAEDREHARQILFRGEEHAVETVFTGRLDAAAVTAAATTLTGDAAVLALARVEQSMAAGSKARGIIVMQRSTATILGDHLTSNGGSLRTKLGTPVAAVAGWDATDAVIFGVGPVRAIRSEIVEFSEFDTLVNDSGASAERTYLIGYECGSWSASAAGV